jgi:hypothetical protein
MKYSEIKEVKEFTGDDWREAVEHITIESNDFEAGNHRFIHEDDIDEIMQDELSSDEYILGCFNDFFLADVLDIDINVIEEMQAAEAFEAIGKLVISLGKLGELQQQYVSADGYGHHFSSWDGSEEQLGDYYIFRVG